MVPLHRHQIAWLSDDGWRRVLGRCWEGDAQECVEHWAKRRLPLVVTRQPEYLSEGCLALGLSAPARWSRRRLMLQVPRSEVAYFDEFPLLDRIAPQLPGTARASAIALAEALAREGITTRAYGSFGWQAMTGLAYARAGSDLDLWMNVSGTAEADAAVTCLAGWSGSVRLDGELVFPGEGAVAWREWQAWREGRTRGLLVKRLHGVATVQTMNAFDRQPEDA
ncbi:malonate decarboxylase holo-[acyl-carrier-protein] synthase [Roseateles sp. SL47]|uniref:malonate decarboxylase holo-[acyl-carrier-protein] synthase n=1 Tax=Roseateles sp. SL47 TaxID=2995138 RepID=UPI00226FBDAB|nr:malonate decarboxylase holo-[acyl-carrier-protein] synthase [Roseateles sp. SL47]WAC73751.1 malonate decarboxylase holo-[acyl-carrier-protein] synthase [Roseateles sp. SL47]